MFPVQFASFVILKQDHVAVEIRFVKSTGQVLITKEKWYLFERQGGFTDELDWETSVPRSGVRVRRFIWASMTTPTSLTKRFDEQRRSRLLRGQVRDDGRSHARDRLGALLIDDRGLGPHPARASSLRARRVAQACARHSGLRSGLASASARRTPAAS